jgi:YjbE family integral membrane protein
MPSIFLQWITSIMAIILVDLALSGDNALVIGASAAKLSEPDRHRAILFGGLAAIILRILLTFVAVLILQIPFIQTIAGFTIFVIAILLLRDSDESKATKVKALHAETTFLQACLMIVVADISMSTDNVLAIAALSKGNYLLLTIGLLLSIAMLMVASSLVAFIIAQFPMVMYLAGAILAWTSATMVLEDKALQPILSQIDAILPGPNSVDIPVIFLTLFGVWAIFIWRSQHHGQSSVNNG